VDDTTLIGLDWGTSNCRAFRLAADGAIAERRGAPLGILQIEGRDFAGAFQRLVGDWLDRAPGAPVLMCGMIGSRQGWVEAPYVAAPASSAELAAKLVGAPLAGRVARIVPGLEGPALGGGHDVMRGEETQIFGALALAAPAGGRVVVCLPGTHSKWAEAVAEPDGTWRVVRFATFMTGEVYAVLRDHSILGRLMQGHGIDHAAFGDGLARSSGAGGLLHQLFLVRTDGLFGARDHAGLAGFLSGLLIGHEVRAALAFYRAASVVVVGVPALTRAYASALAREGVDSAMVPGEDAAACGLFAVARMARLVSGL
jgi:2-dehydro-3-deoxygalactonokinase